jgi:hypothetical protein
MLSVGSFSRPAVSAAEWFTLAAGFDLAIGVGVGLRSTMN